MAETVKTSLAVVHGGVESELRQASAKQLASMPFDGFAIGGSLGKNTEDVKTVLQYTVSELPKTKPRHLLGIGDLPSIDAGVGFGIDTFDSAYPTKNARHGNLLQHQGHMIKIGKRLNKTAFEPVDAHCVCYTCTHYTKAYLYHLFKAKEPTFHTLATIHNLACMNDKMAWYRQAILDGKV